MRRLLYFTLLCVLSAAPTAGAEPYIRDAFSPRQGATDLVIDTIREARKTIRVAAYSFTSMPIAQALVEAHARGVDVRVVLDESNRHHYYSAMKFLQAGHVPARTNNHYGIMHDKFMVIDGATLELGSFNYTKAAEISNAENVLVIKEAPGIVKDYVRQWEKLWEEGAHPLPLVSFP
jgi:phosphatidylserine/phosphatidylglycerophosphate/cardiolipin synthase-like enzyme